MFKYRFINTIMQDKRGLFVIFEGIDGSGKNTQLIKLIEYIEKLDKYQDIIKTREPWKSGEIKNRLAQDKDAYSDSYGMARLYIEDRIAHSREIKARLDEGYFVLCERYKMSTCAYQWMQGASLYKLFKLHECQDILIPDLTFFIDVSAEIAQKRRIARGVEKEKFEDWKFQKDLVSHYNSLIDRSDCENLFGEVISINGRGPIDEVSERVKKAFDQFYLNWKNQNS